MTQEKSNCIDPWKTDTNSARLTPIKDGFDDDFVNPSQLPDSVDYIQSLERKLAKVTGKSVAASAKDVVKSLSKIREDAMSTLLSSDENGCDFNSDGIVEASSANGNALAYVERRLFPEKQVLSAEEIQKLLEQDFLAKATLAQSEPDPSSEEGKAEES